MLFISVLKFNIFEWVFHAFLKDRKLARNAASLTHATGAITLNAIHILWPDVISFDTCANWSTGYFFYDMSSILIYDKINKMKMMYLYHHLIASYIISLPPSMYYGDRVLFWGELSNIPSYFVYHYLHSAPQQIKLQWWLAVQKVVYGGIRVPVITWLTYNIWNNAPDKLPVLLAMPVYFMGLVATATMLKG